MKELTCIECPNGCTLIADEKDGSITVSGNSCPRGESFAVSELTHPVRTLCSVVGTSFEGAPVLPVRTSGPIPKERVFDVMKELKKYVLHERVGIGDVIIKDLLNLGVDIVVTDNLLNETELNR
ncbi:MAG: DUF1667 domain-containing protein [Oscillospiraceae bacterium]